MFLDLRIVLLPEEFEEVHEQFESITRQECDEAATSLNDDEFKEAAEEAIRRVRKRRAMLNKKKKVDHASSEILIGIIKDPQSSKKLVGKVHVLTVMPAFDMDHYVRAKLERFGKDLIAIVLIVTEENLAPRPDFIAFCITSEGRMLYKRGGAMSVWPRMATMREGPPFPPDNPRDFFR